MRNRICLFALVIAAFGQLPPSGTLSPGDRPLFRAEVARMEGVLATASDGCTAQYAMARTFASGKQFPETIDWLRKLVALKAGIDPSRDSIFADLRGTKEFAAVMEEVRAATPAISNSQTAFKVSDRNLFPESVAWDPAGKRFYFGDMLNGRIVSCKRTGVCENFTHERQDGLESVLGVKVDAVRRTLWAVSQAGLFQYDLDSARLIQVFVLPESHLLNDLAVALNGDVFVTDTRVGAVWWLSSKTGLFVRLMPEVTFGSANGIAVSANQKLLYVAGFPDGISVVDLATRSVHPIGHPAGLCLGAIDGMYFYRDSLIAIQNGFMNPRVVRFDLSADGLRIERFDILERRNPVFDGITGGTIAGTDFFYMANVEDDRMKAGIRADPIVMLKVNLNRK